MKNLTRVAIAFIKTIAHTFDMSQHIFISGESFQLPLQK